MSWDNMHLKNILSSDTYSSHVPDNSSSGSFNSQGQPLWHGKEKNTTAAPLFLITSFTAEPIPLCAARVDSLRSHGHMEAALRLAVSVVRTMKQQQLIAQRRWHQSQQALGCSTSSMSKSQASCRTTACTSRLTQTYYDSFFNAY